MAALPGASILVVFSVKFGRRRLGASPQATHVRLVLHLVGTILVHVNAVGVAVAVAAAASGPPEVSPWEDSPPCLVAWEQPLPARYGLVWQAVHPNPAKIVSLCTFIH
jgi:hypothetical protein